MSAILSALLNKLNAAKYILEYCIIRSEYVLLSSIIQLVTVTDSKYNYSWMTVCQAYTYLVA